VPIKTLRDYMLALSKKTTEMIIEEANRSKPEFSKISKVLKKDGLKN